MAAKGDVVANMASYVQNAYCDIQPPENEHWTIHNIIVGGTTDAELYRYNGTNEILVDVGTKWIGIVLHCTNTERYRVKQKGGISQYIAYDGICVKA
jgi:hypothetical protein